MAGLNRYRFSAICNRLGYAIIVRYLMSVIGITRKFVHTAAMEASGSAGENASALVGLIFRIVRVVVLLSVWRAIFAAKPTEVGLSIEAILTYTLIAEIFADQLSPRTHIEWHMFDGGIAMNYLQPMNLPLQFAARMVGRWIIGLVFVSLPLILLAPWLGVNVWPSSPLAAVLFVGSLLLSAVVGVALDFVFAALIVVMQGSAYLIGLVRTAIATVLSGALLPLSVLPYGLGDVFQWLPFASTASSPLRIYTGDGSPTVLIAIQVFWAISLWLLANWLWRVNRERFVSYGG